jgi:diamine N-acetyltransferase
LAEVLAENLAEAGNGLSGVAELLLTSAPSAAENLPSAELVGLYVQPKAQGMSLGRSLFTRAEQWVQAANIANLSLTALEGNHNARAFYERVGYADVGATTYTFQVQTYPNRVLAKRFVEATRFAL